MFQQQNIAQVLMSVFTLGQIHWTCGNTDVAPLYHYTATYFKLCNGACGLHGSKYFWCSTDQGWDYCSPSHNFTYRNEPCQSNHWCDLHGYRYYWCYTKSSWDYCGFTELYNPSIRQKRQPNNIIEICSVNDRGNKKVTRMTAEKTKDILHEQKWKPEIKKIISQWENGFLGDRAKSELTTTDNLRIDLQQLVKKNNMYYYNLQIQLNKIRQNNESTTLAQVLMPKAEDIPVRYVKRAFIESYNLQARVSIDVTYGNVPAKQGQNCD